MSQNSVATMFRVAAAIAAFVLVGVTPVSAGASGSEPTGVKSSGVTMMATLTMSPGSYVTYRKILAEEIPFREKNGMKFLRSYRVIAGRLEKYVDFWWAPNYETFEVMFHNPPHPDPKFMETMKETAGAIQNVELEIVEEEAF